mgnify:CR=1 FL=1
MRALLPFVVAACLVASWFVQSCEKLDLPDETGTLNPDTVSGDSTDKDWSDPDWGGDTLSVAAAKLRMGEYVGVKGYLVGYIKGSQLSQSVFGLPGTSANTNMLIADAPDVTEPALCMPVLLEPEKIRPMINLYDHPEYYQCPVYVEGMVTTYFTVSGIREVDNLILWDKTEAALPDVSVDLPGLDSDTQHVDGGRGMIVCKIIGRREGNFR